MRYITHVIQTIKNTSPKIYWVSLITVFLTLVCFAGLLLDDRILMGVNVWLKPLKFSVSIFIFIITYGFLISLYPYSKKKISILTGITAWTFLVELLIIICQGARGVKSHYNMETPLDALMFASLGILVSVNILLMVLMAIDAIRLKLKSSKTIQWSIVLGWLIALIGSWVGGDMIRQMSHNVGIADGGAGLPGLNWSTIAGDLRVAHFFGLHAIQLIPLFAFVVTKIFKEQTKKQIATVTIFGLLYSAWMGFTFYQAKQGIALIEQL